MPAKRVTTHLIGWLGVFCFWLLLTLDHHPTLPLAIIATAIIVGCSAAAVYLNSDLLMPRLARLRWPGYLTALLAIVVVLALAATASIGLVYDSMWGPDPLRFSFWTNVALDGAGIILHLLASMLILRPRRETRLAAQENIGK